MAGYAKPSAFARSIMFAYASGVAIGMYAPSWYQMDACCQYVTVCLTQSEL